MSGAPRPGPHDQHLLPTHLALCLFLTPLLSGPALVSCVREARAHGQGRLPAKASGASAQALTFPATVVTHAFFFFAFFFSLSFLAEPTSVAGRVAWFCGSVKHPPSLEGPEPFLTHGTAPVTTGPPLGHSLRGAGRELWAAEHVAHCGPLVVGPCRHDAFSSRALGTAGLGIQPWEILRDPPP